MRKNMSKLPMELRQLPVEGKVAGLRVSHQMAGEHIEIDWDRVSIGEGEVGGKLYRRIMSVGLSCQICGNKWMASYYTLRAKQWRAVCGCEKLIGRFPNSDEVTDIGVKILWSGMRFARRKKYGGAIASTEVICICGRHRWADPMKIGLSVHGGLCLECSSNQRHRIIRRRKQNKDNYVDVFIPKWHWLRPFAGRSGRMPEHRMIMAENIGRPLERHEIVHHIDGDKANNRLDNLRLLVRDRHHTGSGDCNYYQELQLALSTISTLLVIISNKSN